MNSKLDALLCERYPLIFANRHGSISTSCMPFGFECGDGWFSLIDTLCERLQFLTDHNGHPQAVATQVKEKYGELVMYVELASVEQFAMIDMAQAFSARICETCGQPGQVVVNGGCFMARCSAHAPADALTRDEYFARREAADFVKKLVKSAQR